MASTETLEERREREVLRRRASLWLPTLDAELVDRIVATAWLEATSSGAPAAAEVRRLGAQILAGDDPALTTGARARVAGIALAAAPIAEPAGARRPRPVPRRRSRRLRRRRPARRSPVAWRPLVGASAAIVLLLVAAMVGGLGGGGRGPAPRATHERSSGVAKRDGARAPRPSSERRRPAQRRVGRSSRPRHARSHRRPRARRPAPTRAVPPAAVPKVAPAVPAPTAVRPAAPARRDAPTRRDDWGGEFRP